MKNQNGTLVIDTINEMRNISHCIGCNNCWLKTPGICVIKDAFQELFQNFLQAKRIIFIADTKFGFVSHKMKRIIDRLIALSVPYTKLYKGEMRHASRYKKCWEIGLLYDGDGDKVFLNEWLDRFCLNFFCKSLGAYPISEKERFIQ